jgi:capsid assembly protease
MRYPHLATRLYNSLLLITPGKAEVIEQVFRAHNEGRATALKTDEVPRRELALQGMTRTDSGYMRTQSGVALIQVIGTLVQRADSMDAASGLIGYNRIATQLQAAVEDPRADAILLEIDSNGGEAAGVMDLAAKIVAAKMKKPTWAIANEGAFSAAYWLASAAQRVPAPESGMVGSIGVVMMHVDQSIKDAKAGMVYTPIFAGDRKVDFSAHAPLSDDARATAQAEVDRLYEMFVASVADHRKLATEIVRDTQAGLFHAKAALDLGLIDAVESYDATLEALVAEGQRFRFYGPRAATSARATIGDSTMTTATADKPAATAGAVGTEQLAAAQARGFTEGKAEGIKAGAESERARIAGILGHAEATDRRALAEHVAFKTGSTVEEAVAMLAAAPKTAAAPTNLLAAAMSKIPNPNVGADGQPHPDAEHKPVVISASAVFDQRRKQAGHGK